MANGNDILYSGLDDVEIGVYIEHAWSNIIEMYSSIFEEVLGKTRKNMYNEKNKK